jgi:hypothetical protein
MAREKAELPDGMPGAGAAAAEAPDGADELARQMDNMMGGTQSDVDGLLSTMNLSNVSDGGFDVLTNGETYEFWIKSVKPGKSSNGNKKIMLILVVTEDYAEAGKVISDHVTFTEAAMWRTKSLAKATGTLADNGTIMVNSFQDYVGYKVRGKIVNDTYNGEVRSKIDGGFKEPDGGPQSGGPAECAPAGASGETPPGL